MRAEIKQYKKQILDLAREIKAFDSRGLTYENGYTFDEERAEIKRLEQLINKLKGLK